MNCFEKIHEKGFEDFETALIEEVKEYEFKKKDVINYFYNNLYFGGKELLEYYDKIRETEEGKEYTFTECAGRAIKEYLESEIIYEQTETLLCEEYRERVEKFLKEENGNI